MLSRNLGASVALTLMANVALAEPATVQLTNGGRVTGELLEYVPGDHVTVQVEGQEPLRFGADELVRVDVGKLPPVAPAPPLTRGPTPRTPEERALLDERTVLLLQKVGLAGPITLLSLGVLFSIYGVSELISDRQICNDEFSINRECRFETASDVALISLGAVGAAVGSYWLVRRVNARRSRNARLLEIESELNSSPLRASLAPWGRPGAHASYGLSAVLQF
ncbi:MAG: hypothetical protein RL385_2600 [Pseudomonadota bacterium]